MEYGKFLVTDGKRNDLQFTMKWINHKLYIVDIVYGSSVFSMEIPLLPIQLSYIRFIYIYIYMFETLWNESEICC